jgi:hypothetical protein
LILSAFVLCASITLVIHGSFYRSHARFQDSVRSLLPSPPPGWKLEEQKIASSPEMEKAVGELLNFDDGVYVNYIGPGRERISVYIAYWTPGKMSHRLVAGHTPDVCWPGNGWRKIAAARLDMFKIPDPDLPPGSKANPPEIIVPAGEARTFTIDQNREYVWFWHMVGSESKSYSSGYSPPWHAAITDILHNGLNQRQEQFFIRISSPSALGPQLQNSVLLPLLSKIPWPCPESS